MLEITNHNEVAVRIDTNEISGCFYVLNFKQKFSALKWERSSKISENCCLCQGQFDENNNLSLRKRGSTLLSCSKLQSEGSRVQLDMNSTENQTLAITIGYFFFAEKVYNLVVCAGIDRKVYLHVNKRRGKDGHFKRATDKSFTCHLFPINQQRLDPTRIRFLFENSLNLSSRMRWTTKEKERQWNIRLGVEVQISANSRKRKSISKGNTVALVDIACLPSLQGENKDQPYQKRPKLYATKEHSGVKTTLPSFRTDKRYDIDHFFETDALKGLFSQKIPHATLAAAIQNLPSLIQSKVVDGESIGKNLNHIFGALADRLFSHCGWEMLAPEPTHPTKQFDRSRLTLDIDQVALKIKGFNFPVAQQGSENAQNSSLFRMLEYADKQITDQVELSNRHFLLL